MAESAVSFLVNKLASFLEEETKLLGGVRKEVVFVKNELEAMKAFLRVVDKMEEPNPEIQGWVKQVREASYDTEDVLDEFMLRLPHHRGQGFFASLCKISCYVKTLKARHWIASEIQDIKSQIKNISESHKRYSLNFNVGEIGSSSIAGTKTRNDRREDAFLLEEAKLVGINKHKEQLMQWLIEEHSELQVVSIVGMGGLGKTTLVGKVYNDTKVKNHFKNHAWITVSRSFKLEELLKDMIQQLYDEIKEPIPKGVETMNSQRLKIIINDFLRERRYVLVLDDVWTIDDWDAFKIALPDSKCGSRVILTTRTEKVALKSSKECHGNVYKLAPLSKEESWALFCQKTFNDDRCPPHLVELSKTMLKRCSGLPLAIVVISGVLATKNQNIIDEWKMVCHSPCVELEGDDGLERMERILLLSYNDLPFYLKSCFLYLSIFPEDHLIERMRLIRLWIAEGFVEEKDRSIREEVADDYINQLINRSLIQVAETTLYGRVKLCRIHDLLRDIILSKSKDQNLVTIASEQKSRWPEKVRRLSIHDSWNNVQENKNVSRLRSLLLFGMVDSIPNSSLLSLCGGGGVRLLKVLDLRGAPVDAFPNEITKLFHLRYLSLRDTKVKMLPSSIGKLQNLQTLDLKNTHVTVLPVEISQLTQLCHLLVYRYTEEELYQPFHCICGFKGPARIGGLGSLQKLCFIEANEGSGILVKEMGILVQLRRLGIIKLRREDGVDLCSSIEKMSNLRSLSLASAEKDEIIDLQHLSSPPQLLQRVYLRGRLEKLPHWIPSLHGLVIVRLRWSRLRDDPLEPLGALPNLVELVLEEAYDGETLCFKGRGFQRLKVLWLERLEGLKVVRVEQGSMPNLGKLDITCCKLLERVPSGIECLTNLNELDLCDMSDEFMKALEQDGGDGDQWKIEHISRVRILSSKDGSWKEDMSSRESSLGSPFERRYLERILPHVLKRVLCFEFFIFNVFYCQCFLMFSIAIKFLWLERLDGLKVVRVEEGSMPNLGQLVIRCCKLLERVPSGIECLSNLNDLDLCDMCDEFVKAVKQDGGDGDKWKIAHISRVGIGSSKYGTWKGYLL